MNSLKPHKTWDIIDSSKLQTSMNCMRQFFFEYILGWRSTAPNNHLEFGKAWHKAQEHILLNGYEDRHVLNAFSKLIAEYRKEFPEESDELYIPKTPDRALKALGEYADKFRSDLSEFEVLYTEIGGSVMLSENTKIYFRMDSILKDSSDQPYFSIDHKTGSRMGRQWRDQWPLYPAIGTYTHVMKCIYPPEQVRGIKVRGTFFYKTKIDFDEVLAWKSNDQMQTWLWNTLHWMHDLEYNLQVLMNDCSDNDSIMMAFPMNPVSCTKYYGCPYHDFCLAWPNPLRRCEEPPLGFKIDFWDPTAEETTHKMEL